MLTELQYFKEAERQVKDAYALPTTDPKKELACELALASYRIAMRELFASRDERYTA
jgi:hypothetical protein